MTASGADKHGGSHSHTGLARLNSTVSKVVTIDESCVLTETGFETSVWLAQARKPYTITKQRERWTDSEHDLFLEALKMYGRAWKSIQGASSGCSAPQRLTLIALRIDHCLNSA